MSAPTPRLIFLSVRPDQRELANPITNALTDRIRSSQGWAFKQPLYNAVGGMFYYCNPAFDMGKVDSEVPYEPKDAWLFYPKLEAVMREHFGVEIIQRMARDYIRENIEYFDYLIFADGWQREREIEYLAAHFGPSNCTLVHINPPQLFMNAPGIRNLQIAIGPDFDKRMDTLAKELVDEPELPLDHTRSELPLPL